MVGSTAGGNVVVDCSRDPRRQATVARRRMQLLAIASAALVVALLLAVLTTRETSGIALATQILGFLSGLAFLLGFAPPTILRLW